MLKFKTLLILVATVSAISCQKQQCNHLLGTYTCGPDHIVLIEEDSGAYIITDGDSSNTCDCNGHVLTLLDGSEREVSRVDSSHIAVGSLKYTSEGAECMNLVGVYACVRGNRCEVFYEREKFIFDYFGNTFECYCDGGGLVAQIDREQTMPLTMVSAETFQFNGYEYMKVRD